MHFQAVLELHGKTATGIEVPAAVVEALGAGKRPAVRVTLKAHTYRTTVAPMGGVYLVPVSAEVRTAAGVSAGETLDVGIEVDTEPRDVVLPDDFREALDADEPARRFFDGLSYSKKRTLVLPIEQAKAPDTRQRRIAKAIESLRAGRA